MAQVKKRNGQIEQFDVTKIAKAIYKARGDAEQTKNLEYCMEEAKEIQKMLPNHDSVLDIEFIQDAIERYLMKKDELEVFKLFTFYRAKRTQERNNPWANNDERQDMFLQKYTKKGETKKQFIERVSMGNPVIAKIIRNKEGIWGGRNLYAIGRDGNITGSNCYVAIPPEDSLKDIYRAAYDIARTYAFGGGQGLNLSKLRPKGAAVNNSSNTTPGVMTFAELYSFITLNTQQESRRGALMLVLDVNHPDIIEFITAKLDITKINGANNSISVTHDFMSAVENDTDWTMAFDTEHEKIEKTVRARELMELIAYANHTVGDPGFLLMDAINDYHLLSEYENMEFNCTNPCGEQPLRPDGSCNLGSINFNAFVRNPFTEEAYFDFDRFKEVTTEMIWGLDDLLTLLGDRHALPAQIEHVIEWREIGLGNMGLADLALSMGTSYGSDEFNTNLEKIMSVMANTAAQASALRAKELGVFPMYDYEKISASRFFKEAYTEETKEMIRKYGLRNSRLLSIAPTGTISGVLGVSGGVEPFYLLGYNRIVKSIHDQDVTIQIVEKTPLALMKHLGVGLLEDLPEWAQVNSQNISFKKRAKVQSTIQKYVDTAISSTFNLPNEANIEEIIDIYMLSWKYGLKGATVFRNNCAKSGILSGNDEKYKDYNPAPYPSITVRESWFNKKTGITKDYVNFIQIKESQYSSEKIEHEKCPLCGAHLVKRQGCTKCSDLSCTFEKCAI